MPKAPTKSPRKPSRAPSKHASKTQPEARPQQESRPAGPVGVSSGVIQAGEKVGIYGPGGIGKTELCASLADVGVEPLFIDLDRGTFGLDVDRATVGDELATSFEEVRAVLHNLDAIQEYGAVVIDTFSTLEDRVREWVIEHVPHEKGRPVQRIEDYGFGKGFSHIFETALLVLQDLDAIARRGTNVIVVCHQCAEKVPHAEAEDYLEYMPRLQSPPRVGKLRERVFEWSNHFFRIDFDRFVEDGRAAPGDSRSIHTTRTTTAWGKHRTMPSGREFPDVIPFPRGDTTLWQIMFGEGE